MPTSVASPRTSLSRGGRARFFSVVSNSALEQRQATLASSCQPGVSLEKPLP